MEELPINEPRTRILHSRIYFLWSSSIWRSMASDLAFPSRSAMDMELLIVQDDGQVVSGERWWWSALRRVWSHHEVNVSALANDHVLRHREASPDSALDSFTPKVPSIHPISSPSSTDP